MIRFRALVFSLLMLAAAASPASAIGMPQGASAMPMHGMPAAQGTTEPCPCNCAMPMHASAAAAEARSSSPARSAGGPEPVPCPGTAIPAAGTTNGMSGRVGGIRRIYPKNVLDHPDRAAVYAVIVARPGIDTGSIGAELSMNRETLRYHLDKLEAATKVVVMRDHGIGRHYENHGRYTPLERRVLQHFWNPTGKAILSLIASQPGITQAGISARASITAPTARWYLQRFRDDGIIAEQRDGKYTRYAVVPEAAGFIAPAQVSPPSSMAVQG